MHLWEQASRVEMGLPQNYVPYVVPQLVYGLHVEVEKLLKTDFEKLEQFQRKCLRQIQGLPDRVSNTVTLALFGIPPAECTVHKTVLNCFVNILRDKSITQYRITERQLVIKSRNDQSWFNDVKTILELYDLPNPYELLKKPSFEKKKKNHPVWASVRYNIQDRKKAELKMKLLTGSYTLQANRANFNEYTVNPTCKLCNVEPENREHFLARCTFLEYIRYHYRENLSDFISTTEKTKLNDSRLSTVLTTDERC